MRLNTGRVVKACCALWILLCPAMLEGCAYVRYGAAVRSASHSPKPASKPKAVTKPKTATKFFVPLPALALLAPSAQPDCEFPAADPNADERQKLDYERQCYRHAEIIVRDRLTRLQGSVREMAGAINQ